MLRAVGGVRFAAEFLGTRGTSHAETQGVPILLRQYLKLGGRLLEFNVDAAFADAIDCLIMVDLRETDPRVLSKYMGREAARAFLARHGAADPRDTVSP